jgi:hypothetical protein
VATWDATWRGTVFVIIDVDLHMQPGGPVPVGVAALAVRGGDWVKLWRLHETVTSGSPVSLSGADQSIGRQGRPAEGSAGAALAGIESRLTNGEHRVVAAVGFAEAALIRAERAHCPRLASLVMWDALRLAQLAYPTVQGGLEEHARNLDIPVGSGRRPVTQEVWVTAELFRRTVERGVMSGLWGTVEQVDELVGKVPPPVEEEYFTPPPVQESLFD